ncbi:MAG: Rho-binding antiterminator [Pseudomonadota bacterium]
MISCTEYDTIELVCMYRYPVTLHLRSGENVTGVATDTVRNDKKEECIKLLVDNTEQVVVLDTIASLRVNVDNPHFQQVSFGD